MRTVLALSMLVSVFSFGEVAEGQAARPGGAREPARKAPAPAMSNAAGTTLLMSRLSALSADSMEGRLAGSPGGVRARLWIERELRSIGITPLGSNFEQ